jgi:hypothetical protein
MTNEIFEYFKKEYEKCRIKVVPYHWPDFKTKEEVDEWIKNTDSMADFMSKLIEGEDA